MIISRCRPRIVTALLSTFCIASVLSSNASAEVPTITPELVKPGKLLFADDFERDSLQSQWSPLHMTRWTISDGMLRGIPATEAFQQSRRKHNGGTPSMKLVVPVKDCIFQISFRLSGKMNGAHFGFNDGTVTDGTGHVCRVTFDIRKGTQLIKDKSSKVKGDSDEVLDMSDWKPNRDQWYTLLLETQGDRVSAKVLGGPTLKGKHTRLDVNKSWVNLPTRGGGEIHYDNVLIWQAAPSAN